MIQIQRTGFRSHPDKGFTLLELITVLVIIAVSAGIGLASMRPGIENRQAKQALETARSIAHAVKVYQLNAGALPSADLSELIADGYINSEEFAYPDRYTYRFVPNGASPAEWAVEAVSTNPARTLRVENDAPDFLITDSKKFYKK